MSGLVHPDQHVRNATQNSCAGQLIDGEVVARAEPAIADGEPGSRGPRPRPKCGSEHVHQEAAAFFTVTSKKS